MIDIALYIAKDNPTRALSFADELEAACLKLGDAPAIGKARPTLGVDIRTLSQGNYLVIYRAQDGNVRIERILHGARDIEGLFTSEAPSE